MNLRWKGGQPESPNGVTFDQNGQNAISAVSEFLAANLPNWRFRTNKNVIRTIEQIVKFEGFENS